MKYFLYTIAIGSLLWGTAVNGGFGSMSGLLVTSYTAPFWGTALLYLYDFAMAIAGRNSPYMTKFYASLKNDIFSNALFGLTLFFLFWLAPAEYSLSNIDIAALGLPFVIVAALETLQSAKIKIADRNLPKKVIGLLMMVQIATFLVSIWFLRRIMTGELSSAQSLWIQITILCAALTFYFGAKQIRFVITQQKMEVSPVLLQLFSSIPNSPQLYKGTESTATAWNAMVKKEKAAARKKSGQRRKRNR